MGLRSNPWPWGIGLGLGAVVVANAIMIHVAVSNPSAPAAADHYGESLRWDEVQAERGRAQALGWQVELEPCAGLDPRAELDPPAELEHGCAVRVRVRDAQDAPVSGLHGRLQAQRADDPGLDREATVSAAASPGEYEATLALARPGLYTVAIRLEGGPAPWVDERRIRVPGATAGAGTP